MVKISGENKKVEAQTIAQLINELGIKAENIAVVKNGSIVSRRTWDLEKIVDSDEIDFFSPVGGG